MTGGLRLLHSTVCNCTVLGKAFCSLPFKMVWYCVAVSDVRTDVRRVIFVKVIVMTLPCVCIHATPDERETASEREGGWLRLAVNRYSLLFHPEMNQSSNCISLTYYMFPSWIMYRFPLIAVAQPPVLHFSYKSVCVCVDLSIFMWQENRSFFKETVT